MTKRKKKRKFSVFRFTALIITAFVLICILNMGFNFIYSKADQNNEISATEIKDELSASFRVKRAIFIKSAVNAKVNKENFVKTEEMPRDLIHAIIAVEDSRFYSHHGFDLEAIGRATLVNIESGKIEEGASTITQQLVKNLFLSSEQTFDRKIEELILAFAIETVYNKDDILELYLNTIYFGSNFYGIKEASEGYFGKEPKDLNLEEAAMLAGLPNAPSLYSPYVDLELAKKRQRIVLDAMEKKGYIINSTAEKAKVALLRFANRDI